MSKLSSRADKATPPNVGFSPAGKHAGSIVLFLVVAAGVFGADLLSKSLSFRYVAGQPVVTGPDGRLDDDAIPPHPERTVIPRILALKLTVNTGAVFGIGKGRKWLFVAVSILAVGVIGRIFTTSDAGAWGLHLAIALILAGALGNLYDRMLYSVVRDMCWLFPHVKLPFGYHWPVGFDQLAPWVANTGSDELYPWIFNVADVSLLFGVIWVVLLNWRRGKHQQSDSEAGH